jgi:hypothetical protein
MTLALVLYGLFTVIASLGGYLIVAHFRGPAAGAAFALAVFAFFAGLALFLLYLARQSGLPL